MSKKVSQKPDEKTTENQKTNENQKPPRFFAKDGDLWANVTNARGTHEVRVCAELTIVGLARSLDSDGWCVGIRFKDPDGVVHEELISFEELTRDPSKVISRVASGGLRVNPQRESRELFSELLQGTTPKKRMRISAQVGWHGEDYVFTDNALTSRDAPVIYSGPHRFDSRTKCAGTLDEWRTEIGERCRQNSRPLFAVSAAFTSPLLRLLEEESAGFHFVGQSTDGKTTVLAVGGSVWGGGHSTGFVRSWRTTENACENLARQHNDGLLLLDELAQIDPKQAQTVGYTILNGQPKSRMNRLNETERAADWKVLLLSSGEITLGDHIATVGARIRGGQLIRMIDIPSNANCGRGVFEALHGLETPGEFARALSSSALHLYGTPIRRFLELLIRDRQSCLDSARRWRDSFLQQVSYQLGAEALRAARRFALVTAGGELATKLGITGWQEGEATEGVNRCFQDWLAGRGTDGSSDQAAAVSQVLGFIEAHGESRFRQEGEYGTERIVHNRVGFARTNFATKEYEHLFLPQVFRSEVCKGFDPQLVLRALAAKGLLRTQEYGRFTVKRRVEGMSPNQTYYAVVFGD